MITFNMQGLIQTLVKDRQLAIGTELDPVYVTTATANTAATGMCYYRIQAIGENATITNAKDLQGTTISGLTNAVIPAGQCLFGEFSALTFSDPSANCSVQLWVRITADY